MAIVYRTIADTILKENGDPETGWLQFKLSNTLTDGTTTISTHTVTVALDVNGAFTLQLACNDSAGATPTNTRYHVKEMWGRRRKYDAQVLVSMTNPVGLDDLAPVTTLPDLAHDTFLELEDTPDTYTGHALEQVRVNAGGTALEFATGGGGGVTDHGALTGLGDDDHTQYLNNARGDARYDALGAASTVQTNLTSEATTRANADTTEATARAGVQTNLNTHAALTTGAHGGIVASNDARLTNARTPTAHASTHATGDSDPITPASIGALVQADADALYDPLGAAAPLSDSNPADLSTKNPGVANTASRSDHVHKMPGFADVGADPTGAAEDALASHLADADPHPDYVTEAEGAALYDLLGAATSEIAGHVGQSDPHTGYVRKVTLTAKGDVYVRNTSQPARLAVGTNGQVLTADSAQTLGVKWADPASFVSTAKWAVD